MTSKPADSVIQLTAARMQHGPTVAPHQRLQLMSDVEWEEFTEEWANSLKPATYARVERHSGAGDMGIDVCAYTTTDLFSSWDNFQCKHYNKPLSVSSILVELGKVIYYTWKGEYTVPRMYYFCAPHNVGTTLAKLLRKPNELKEKLREGWHANCETKITSTQRIPLSGSLLNYFEQFKFEIFSYKPVLELIEGHRTTPYFVVRFGGGLPDRKQPALPPSTPAPIESVYVRQLLEAYADHLNLHVPNIETLSNRELLRHFEKSRCEFYCAEGLREFSMDHLPQSAYEHLKKEMLMVLTDTVDSVHLDGYACVKATVKHAQSIQIDSHPLKDRMNPSDRAGICHQLANERSLEWVKK